MPLWLLINRLFVSCVLIFFVFIKFYCHIQQEYLPPMPTDCIRSCRLRNYNSDRRVNHYYILLYFMSYVKYFIISSIFLTKHINCCPNQAFVISIQLCLVWIESSNGYERTVTHLSTTAVQRLCRSVTHLFDIYLSVTFYWPNLLVLITCFK